MSQLCDIVAAVSAAITALTGLGLGTNYSRQEYAFSESRARNLACQVLKAWSTNKTHSHRVLSPITATDDPNKQYGFP